MLKICNNKLKNFKKYIKINKKNIKNWLIDKNKKLKNIILRYKI